jgi:hypothetical protein
MATRVDNTSIPWTASIDDAVAKAKTSGKFVLLDFFSPT